MKAGVVQWQYGSFPSFRRGFDSRPPLVKFPTSSLPLYIGVDLGKTWIRIVGCDPKLRILFQIRKPAIPWAQLPAFIRSSLTQWGRPVQRPGRSPAVPANLKEGCDRRAGGLVVACAGAGEPRAAKALRNRLSRLAGKVQVTSDIEAAHWGAFQGRYGVFLICGTGSIALAKDPCRHAARSGGWGPWLGDEGSGLWMGKELLREALQPSPACKAALSILRPHSPWKLIHKIQNSPQPMRELASLSPRILKAARRGNPSGLRITKKSYEHLLELIRPLLRSLHWKKEVPFSWGGGLFRNPFYLSGFLRSLKKRFPKLRPIPPKHSPVLGAILWAFPNLKTSCLGKNALVE